MDKATIKYLLVFYGHIPVVNSRAMRGDDDYGGGKGNIGNDRSGRTTPRCSGR